MNELKPGLQLELRVDRLSLGGDAIGRVGNAVVFVPYGAPGDTLQVELTEVRKNFCRARLVKVLEASPVRTVPPCPYHFQAPGVTSNPEPACRQAGPGTRNAERPFAAGLFCGGCSWQHLVYPFQLDAKRQLVQETLERIGGFRGITVDPTLGMDDPWRYRNKVQQPVGLDGHRVISGFYAPFSHQIVPIDDCLVQSEISVRIINRAKSLLDRFHLLPYDERRRSGWIRHLWVRTNQAGQALVLFITRTEEFPHQAEILETLVREFPEIVGLHQNVNPGNTNVILGRQWRSCGGADYLEERLGGLRFRLSPGAFFQVNAPQTTVLYDQLKAHAGKGQTLLDLYCGVGGIALWLASNFERVIGVDEVKIAISDAINNAQLNDIRNTRFYTAPAERFLAGYGSGGCSDGGLAVVLDPPRSGCEPGVLRALNRVKPANLLYVSCDPGTLARDLKVLASAGFRIQAIQPVDLFPHTAHIETIVRLAPR